MLRQLPPVSNTERQRQFRERNPGYYGRLHAKRRAVIDAQVAQMIAVAQAVAVKQEPLMLPAPVVMLEIPGMNAIGASARGQLVEVGDRLQQAGADHLHR